ncbi:MAG: apolipoprotein N-acyltransferase [Polyangiaceae bacterium]
MSDERDSKGELPDDSPDSRDEPTSSEPEAEAASAATAEAPDVSAKKRKKRKPKAAGESAEAEGPTPAPPSEPAASEPAASKPAASKPAASKPAPPSLGPALPGKVAYPLAILSGVLYFLAFPGIDLWPLAFVALVPLIVAMRNQPTRRAMGLGWMAGFTMTMTGFYWLIDMLKTFSGFGTPLCLLFMSILCGYQGGRIGFMGWLYGRATNRGWPAGPVFCLAFAASELVFPLLFPWYYAATVHQMPALLQLAELGGPILVGLMLIAPNWALSELIFSKLDQRRINWRLVAALVALPIVAAGYGALRIFQVDATVAAAPKAKVGVVQANMSLIAKREDKEGGLRRHVRLSQELIRKEGPLDLVVWPETAVARAMDERNAANYYERNVLPQVGAPAVFGAILVRRVDDVRGYVLFNSAMVSDPATGRKVVGRFNKHYLLAFGEYLPFGETFPQLYEMSPHSGRFTPGTEAKPVPFGDHQLAVFICYEDIIPSFVNSIMKNGDAQLLVNITNDAWFGDSTEPWIHLALSKLRAIEQRRFFVRSTNSGVSAIVDPVGRVVAHTETFKQQTAAAQVAWLDGGTVFRVIGELPWWLGALVIAAMAFVRRKSVDSKQPGE